MAKAPALGGELPHDDLSAKLNEGQAWWSLNSRSPMSTKKKVPRRILVLDVGGSHVKLSVSGRDKVEKFVSGRKMTAAQMVKQVRKLVSPDEYDAVSIGYPGLVFRGRIAAEPFNLGTGWV